MKFLKRSEPPREEPDIVIDDGQVERELQELKQGRQRPSSPTSDDHDPSRRDSQALARPQDRHLNDPDVIEHGYHEEDDPHAPRTLQSKLFGIGFSGYFQLVVICILVGAVFQAGHVNPFEPGFSFQSALAGFGAGVLTLLGWAVQYGLQPLLTGVIVFVPLWLFWRLLSVPFRRG